MRGRVSREFCVSQNAPGRGGRRAAPWVSVCARDEGQRGRLPQAQPVAFLLADVTARRGEPGDRTRAGVKVFCNFCKLFCFCFNAPYERRLEGEGGSGRASSRRRDSRRVLARHVRRLIDLVR